MLILWRLLQRHSLWRIREKLQLVKRKITKIIVCLLKIFHPLKLNRSSVNNHFTAQFIQCMFHFWSKTISEQNSLLYSYFQRQHFLSMLRRKLSFFLFLHVRLRKKLHFFLVVYTLAWMTKLTFFATEEWKYDHQHRWIELESESSWSKCVWFIAFSESMFQINIC